MPDRECFAEMSIGGHRLEDRLVRVSLGKGEHGGKLKLLVLY